MRNIELFNSKSSNNRPFPDPEFDPCPVALEQLAASPTLAADPKIASNPNCFPAQSAFGTQSAGPGMLYRTSTDILYVNYDLTSLVDYSVIFLIQIGISSIGNSDMRVMGFTKIPLVKNVWSYFAISCDYQAGVATAFFRSFDSVTQPFRDSVNINFPLFKLTQLTQLVIAGVETNPYFESTSGFIGNIALVEVGLFYTSDLELLWVGFMPLSAYSAGGVLIDLFFENYNRDSPLVSRGLYDAKYTITGEHTPVYLLDNNLVGVVFSPSASFTVDNVDFANQNSLTRTMAYLLSFNYTGSVPDPLYLIRKGTPNTNGYFAASLVSTGSGGRKFRFEAQGANEAVSWTSAKAYDPNMKHDIEFGLALNANNTAYLLLWDATGHTEIAKLSDSFVFSMAPGNLLMLGNQQSSAASGNVTMYRFSILNSLSNIIYFLQLAQNTDPTTQEINRYCLLTTNFYGNDYACQICKDSILVLDQRRCAAYCPYGFKNAGNDACLPCLQADCSEITSTIWQLYKINDVYYELRPSRPIISNMDYSTLFNVSIPGLGPNDYTYRFVPNPNNQTVSLYLTFKRDVGSRNVTVSFTQDDNNPTYDVNRNIIYTTEYVQYVPVTRGVYQRTCYVDPAKAQRLRGLAIALLVFMAALFIAGLLFSLCGCCGSRVNAANGPRGLLSCGPAWDLGGLWKFILHYWMKLQMISFFLFLGIYMPCCVRIFLGQLYNIDASWNQALGRRINDNNLSNERFRRGVVPNPAPQQFADYGIFPYILHNLGVWFIIQCFILLVYIFLKIWDCCAPIHAGGWFYYLYNIWEWTVMIVGYLLIAMQAFVYAGLNIRQSQWQHSYFTISFIISVLYILVFVLFWLYAAARLLGPQSFFLNPINYNRFIYFFVGYRNDYWSRSYDLWWWLTYLVVGLMLGLVYNSGLAQTIVILAALVIFFFVTLIIQPFLSILMYIIELLVQALIIAAMVLFLVIAAYNSRGCYGCNDAGFETSLCWAIVILLFLALALGFIANMLHLLLSTCCGAAYSTCCIPVRQIVHTNFVPAVPSVTTAANVVTTVPYTTTYTAVPTTVYAQTNMVSTVPVAVAAPQTYVIPTTTAYYEQTHHANLGGAQKSMQQFVSEMQTNALAADTSVNNLTYLSADNVHGMEARRAGTLADDDADEEGVQNNVLRALQTDQVQPDEDFSNLDSRNNFVANRTNQVYQANQQYSGSLAAMSPASIGMASAQTAFARNAPMGQYIPLPSTSSGAVSTPISAFPTTYQTLSPSPIPPYVSSTATG